MLAEVLGLSFVQRALVAGVLLGLLGGYFGAFVVQRGLGFMGDGLAHAAFGGVALGLLLKAEPLSIAVPFTVLVALGITWVRERTELGADTAIGVLFSMSVAMGVVFLSLRRTYSADAVAFLFGSILAVTPADLWTTALVGALVAGSSRMWGRWAYATFDRELARADGLPVTRDDYVLSAFLAVSVVVGVKLVGILLITAFLVIPSATARLLATSFASMTWGAMAIGVVTALAGLALSYEMDVPSGATIVLVQSVFFFAAVAAGRALKR
jgi:zinc transport system permease protein